MRRCVYQSPARLRTATTSYGRLRSQRGTALLDVMVTVLLVALVGGAILTLLTGASRGYGENRARGVAAALAQEDQERMRSMTAAEVVDMDPLRTREVDGVEYTVRSTAVWDTDQAGEEDCQAIDADAYYLRIGSEVTWPSMPDGRPVRLESIKSPRSGSQLRTEGNLGVKITNAAGEPVEGIDVTVDAVPSLTASTNETGCAYFESLPEGNYDVSFVEAGHVDPDGVNAVSEAAGVTAGATTVIALEYDVAASITVDFDTKVGSSPPVPSAAESVSLINPSFTQPRVSPLDPASFGSGAREASFTLTGLFPFQEGYGVYAGGCPDADPVFWGGSPYVATPPPGGSAQVTARTPAVSVPATFFGMPLVRASFDRIPTPGSNPPPPGFDSAACDGTLMKDAIGGGLSDPGVPFGTYDVCAEYYHPWFGYLKRYDFGLEVDDPNGVAAQPTGLQGGRCP